MNRMFFTLTMALLTSSAAIAQQVQTTPAGWSMSAEKAQEAKKQTYALATVLDASADLTDGDLIRTGQGFGYEIDPVTKKMKTTPNWTLSCEVLQSTRQKVCSVEQKLADAQMLRLQWKVALGQDNKPYLVFNFPSNIKREEGLKLSLASFERTIPATDWICAGKMCTVFIEFEPVIQNWLFNEPQVAFRFKDETDTWIPLTAPMKGFKAAIAAGRNDPTAQLNNLNKVAKVATKPTPEAKKMAQAKP